MLYKNKIALILNLFLSASLFSAGKDFDQTIKTWMGKFNTVSTHNRHDAFKSQMGLHLIGGQGLVRPVVEDFNPIHIEFPRISAGCGGIDYATGGLHIANGEEMLRSLKSIATNGACYAFNLGLQVVSPQIAAATKDIQHFANQINSISINSCEVSKAIVQALVPNIERASQAICSEAAYTNSIVDGYIRAKHRCATEPNFENERLKEVKNKNPNLILGDYNIAWEALKKSGIEDEMSKFLFMNITGTIVLSKDETKTSDGRVVDVKRKITVYPSKVGKALDAILYGGKISKAYQLDKGTNGKYIETDIKLRDLDIKHSQSWKTKIYKQLRSLADKFDNESSGSLTEQLSDDDKKLLDSTKMPIGTMMTLMSQWSGQAMDLASLNDCAEILACERLCQFVHVILDNIRSRIASLETIQTDDSLDEFMKNLHRIEKDVRDYERKNQQNFQNKQNQIQYLINFEKNLREKSRGI